MKAREVGIILRNVILGGNLESLLGMGNPQLALQYVFESRFLYRCLFPDRDGLPEKPVWEAMGTEQTSAVLYGHAALEWFRPVASYTADLFSMCMLCQMLKPKVIFEIGTCRGAGALHWAGNAPEAEVYTLDLPPATAPSLDVTAGDRACVGVHADTTRMEFEGRPEARRIHCLYGDTATFDFSPFAGKVDLFFIDGSHSYEYVRNDTMRAYTCCKPGSVIAWHDYGRQGFNGVSKWLHELARQGKQIYRIPGGSIAYTQI
jgi:predicted O-methyltransferase YrrM